MWKFNSIASAGDIWIQASETSESAFHTPDLSLGTSQGGAFAALISALVSFGFNKCLSSSSLSFYFIFSAGATQYPPTVSRRW